MHDHENLKLDIRKEFEDYKKFAFSKSLLDTAVALVMATAVQKMVNGVVDCVIMPILNFSLEGTGNNWRNWIWQPILGMDIQIGELLGRTIDFLIISLAMYVVYSKVKKFLVPDEKNDAGGAVLTRAS